MHSAIQLFGFWALAFVTLCAAVALLGVFYSVIDNDLSLHSLGKEAAIAGTASLVEGASVWLVVSFVPAAGRALLFPAVIVALIYKLSHLEDWNRYDVVLLLVFQIAICFVGGSLFAGNFKMAIIVLGVFAAMLAAIASIARSL
jgi:hypothetical protein